MDAQVSEDTDFIARIRALVPEIAAASDDIEQRRELPPWLLDKLRDGRFFRMLQPRSIGGAELRPVSFATVTEAIATADASTAWCVCQNNGCSMSAAYLVAGGGARDLRAVDRDSGVGPARRAVRGTAGRGRLSHQRQVAFRQRQPPRDVAGRAYAGRRHGRQGRKVRTMLFPKTSVTMHDIWHVVGLRGTGSDEYVVENVFVPENHSMSRDGPAERREDGLLYRFTSNQLYSCGFGGVGLGIARGTMDAFYDLPATKTSRGAAKPMRENNVVQSQVAQCEARWRSARAFLHDTWEQAWAHVEATGEQTAEDRAMIRLASTWAIQSSREVVNTLYHAAGSVAIFEDHPFERRLRDIHTVAQQSQGRQLHYETVGQILLGMPPENQF